MYVAVIIALALSEVSAVLAVSSMPTVMLLLLCVSVVPLTSVTLADDFALEYVCEWPPAFGSVIVTVVSVTVPVVEALAVLPVALPVVPETLTFALVTLSYLCVWPSAVNVGVEDVAVGMFVESPVDVDVVATDTDPFGVNE